VIEIIVPCLYLLSGACIYACFFHLYAGLQQPKDTTQLLLAAMAGLNVFFGIAHAQTLKAQTIEFFALAQKWEFVFIVLFFTLLNWFIACFTKIRPLYLLVSSTAVYIVLFVVNLFQTNSLQYAHLDKLEFLRLPWGELITLGHGVNSFWFYLTLIEVLVSFGYTFYALTYLYRQKKRINLTLILMVGVMLVASLQGVLVRLSIIHSVQLGSFSFFVVMISLSSIYINETHQQLRAKEEKLRTLYELSPLGIAMTDMHGRYVKFNEAFRRIIGYASDQLISLDNSFLTPAEYAMIDKAQFDAIVQKGCYQPYEKEFRHQDGRLIPVRLNSMKVTGADGQPYIWSIIEDITERKQVLNALSESEKRYRRIVETSSEGIWSIDVNQSTQFVNNAICQMLGYTPEEMLGHPVFEFVFEEDKADVEKKLDLNMLGKASHFEQRVKRKDGGACWCLITATVLKDEQGRFAGSFAMFTDITARKRSEDEIRLAAMVYQASSQSMMITDADNRIITVNPAFTEVTGYELMEIIGKTPKKLRSGRHDSSFYQDMWEALNSTGKWQGEVWNCRKNGEIYPERLTINTIYQNDGAVFRRIALFSDMSKEKENEDLIWRQANFDSLTNLPNRRMAYDRINDEIKKIRRTHKHLALLFIDLDRFKEVNDTLGHEIGDNLLKEAAKRMLDCVNDSDIIGRLGGDEFVVVLNDLENIDSVGITAGKLLDRLAAPYQLGVEMAYISASIGITFFPEDATTVATLLTNADQAMYAAKREGRNRFHYFTPAMQESANARMRLTNDMHIALIENQFVVYYQPIVELANDNIHKAEALIRWRHPLLGLISPAQFIPIAEETGQIIAIGDWVYRQAAVQSAYFRQKYHPNFQISINRSPVQFKADCDNRTPWLDYLNELGLPGQSIVVEITESLLMESRDEIKNQLLALRDHGVQVALDDFGTGYSSLSYLKKFDIDYLKIDQSFVQNMVSDANDQALCEAMITMAHKLGIKVIAEGVSSLEQRNLLTNIGCDYAQGYLWSKPVSAENFENLLKN